MNMNKYEKPPLGLEPRWLHDSCRITDILNAMERYADSNISIPKVWIKELKELLQRYEYALEINKRADG